MIKVIGHSWKATFVIIPKRNSVTAYVLSVGRSSMATYRRKLIPKVCISMNVSFYVIKERVKMTRFPSVWMVIGTSKDPSTS